MSTRTRPGEHRDRGTILPIVLIVVVVMALVIVALADYASTTLRYGQVVERSGDRLAAANGAIDTTLEAIDRQASLCALTPVANQPGGYTYELGATINGIEPTITCRSTGPDVTGVEEFALVLTSPGDLNPNSLIRDALLDVSNGGTGDERKVIDGPVFMARPPNDQGLDTLNFGAQVTIRDGDLWYSSSTGCPTPDPEVDVPPELLISPIGYGIRCLTDDWNTLFEPARPTVPVVGTFAPAPAPDTTGICHIWEPGEYATPMNLAPDSYNYFKSGEYYFNFSGSPSSSVWPINNAWVMFGAPGPGGPTIRTFDGDPQTPLHPCESAWLADTGAPTGATIYLGGPSHIDVRGNGALEVNGRKFGGRRVAIQALETQNASTVTDDVPRLVKAASDFFGDSQLVIHGLVWAPFSAIEFDELANLSGAALNGGAVIGELHVGALPGATNHLVRAGSTPGPRRIEITATAVSPEGGTTEVRAVIDYRDGDYALRSRRVLCITPQTTGC